VRYFDAVKSATERCTEAGIRVSLFIDPDMKQIDAAHRIGAPVIELHTGSYADADGVPERAYELERIRAAAAHANALVYRSTPATACITTTCRTSSPSPGSSS